MSFWEMLNTLIIGPINLVFESIFSFVNDWVNNPGIAIIFLSLAINLLILPLYMRADVMQKRARDKEISLRHGIQHIKKTFSGDERMMMLSTYYKQNDYSPFLVIQGSVSLLLQIPFFMAAVQVISNLECLNGASLGPISDLGKPDRLLTIGGISLNLLPVLMTVINLISSTLFSKGGTLKEKVQLYGLAGFFLVFLYNYPSGLVFYWLLNNLFSLIKTICYKIKFPKKERVRTKLPTPNRKVFISGAVFLTLFVGVFIPSNFIASSPQAFVNASVIFNPLWYMVSSGLLAGGFFLLWLSVFYWLASDSFKALFDKIIWALCVIFAVNYMFFGTDFGNLSPALQYDVDPFGNISILQYSVNLATVVAVFAVCCLMTRKKFVTYLLLVSSISVGVMSGYNAVLINNSVSRLDTSSSEKEVDVSFNLNRGGKNVVVIMLDRAIGPYIPYIMAEKPELLDKFEGFTYYDNIVSFGQCTNIASPALLGGYEYTPVEINKRDDELLMTKHHEAHLVMPTLFAENDFEVTLSDPIYINYQWISDMSFFDDYPFINAIKTIGLVEDEFEYVKYSRENTKRNFFCFSLMKSMPLVLQSTLYDDAQYHKAVKSADELNYNNQTVLSKTSATGIRYDFRVEYAVLDSLAEITNISESDKNSFLFMTNDITHEAQILQLPDYRPQLTVDNSSFEVANKDFYSIDGTDKLRMEDTNQVGHYHSNMCAILRLSEWLDYLKEEGVYDNTRIIIVSDHGRALRQFDELIVKAPDITVDFEELFPLLLVKDFDANQPFTTESRFMTNADVPLIAMEGLIENPVNPFTGKALTDAEKTNHRQFLSLSTDYSTETNNGNTFHAGSWVSVKNNIWDTEKSEIYAKEIVLAEHQFPQ